MASSNFEHFLRCCSCEKDLTVTSKTLPCLHTLCQTCLKRTATEENSENSDSNKKSENTDPSKKSENSDPNKKSENSDPSKKSENSDPSKKSENSDPNKKSENSDPNKKSENSNSNKKSENSNSNKKSENSDASQRKCPKCQEGFTLDECHLLPFLSKCIVRHSELRCHLCAEEDIESVGRHWCLQCEKLLCNNCSRVHRQLTKGHFCKDLDGKKYSQSVKIITSNRCFPHGKKRESFCDKCNMYYCDTCYPMFHSSSGCTGVRTLDVKAEILRRKAGEGPILREKMKEFEKTLTSSSEKLIGWSSELNKERKRKCNDIWKRYEEVIENARHEANELCKQTEEETAVQVEQIKYWVAETEKLLKQAEIWLLSYEYLSSDEEKDADILQGLNTLKSKFLSWPEKWDGLRERYKHSALCRRFSNLYSEVINIPSSIKNGTLSCMQTIAIPSLIQKSEPRLIHSIFVTKHDNHIFLCDKRNESVIELNESGKMVAEFRLPNEIDGKISFKPFDICSISADTLAVCGIRQHLLKISMAGGKIAFLKKVNISPIFLIEEIVHTEKSLRSLCSRNEFVFVCDFDFNVYSFTKTGQKLKTIKPDRMSGSLRLRIDPLTGNFWGSRGYDSSSIISSFDFNGNPLNSMNTEEQVFDYCFNEVGKIYFSTKSEIFSISEEKKILYKFDEKESETFPVIFVLEDKIFVCIKNNGKDLIKVFKTF